jgi:hypothetical protein
MLVCIRIHSDYFTFFIECDDPSLILDESRLAGKYPDNTTIVHMDENGNYKVVYGLKLDQISTGLQPIYRVLIVHAFQG